MRRATALSVSAVASLLLVTAALATSPALRAQDGFPELALTSHTGDAVTTDEFLGEFQLLYFGFTHCPDLCPMGLHLAATAVHDLDEASASVRPVFVTIDPKRDTAERLAGYVSAFHPRMLGLTGSSAEIRKLARNYGVDYTVAAFGDEYVVEHSTLTYFVAPDGTVLERFAHDTASSEMTRQIKSHLTRLQ